VQQVIRDIEPHDSAARYAALGVDVVAGRARLVSPWEVAISAADGSERRLSTRAVVIATGASPSVPDLPGLAEVGYLSSDTVWGLRTLPGRLLVLGGGPVGVELAQAFARLGSQVTLVEAAPRLLVREDDEVSALLQQVFAEEGITVLTGHTARRFETVGGCKQLLADHAGGSARIGFDTLLLALGLSARLSGFGLEALGVACGKTVLTNGFLQTNFPNIYAAGDVAGPWQFTHTAAHQAWHAAVNALAAPLWRVRVDGRVIPSTTFTEPEVARVGLNEREAQAQQQPYEVTRFDLAGLDRAIADGQTRGFVKLLTVPGRDRLLGATIVGEHAGELLAEYTLAMKQGIGLNRILGTVHAYPTLAEANKAAAGVWKRAHAPQRLLALAARWHAWRRG
jgi:pyruvate/2-oxoglutarate dehydrogenase complex dihydrolipoamide dehydrogenase (E3) component